MALMLSGLLVATVVLLEPTKSAVANWIEIDLGFLELLSWLAVPSAIGFLGVATVTASAVAFAPQRAVPVLVAVYVALWAQGSLWVWDYGIFNGSPIDWSEHSGKGAIEFAFFAAALTLSLTKPDWVRARSLLITAIVLALQLAALADQARQNAPFPKKPPRSFAGETIESVSHYSRDLNVIIVVLDALQSNTFSKAMDDPELRDAMPPGFTYYRDAVSQFGRTEFSLPSMLLSTMIPEVPHVRGWIRDQMPQSLPARLVERGFDAVVVTFYSALPCDTERLGYECLQHQTLVEPLMADAALREDVSNMFELGLFRLSPHFFKSWVYNDGRSRVPKLYPTREATLRNPKIWPSSRRDLDVFDLLTDSAVADALAPQFRLLHFFASHNPSTLNKNCGYPGDGVRKSVTETTHCILSRLYEFFHRLEEIGVYDQSLIFVVADHGGHIGHWKGVPVFLAKPRGDREPFRTSELPVSLCDVPSSVFDALEIEHDFECESIFSAQMDRRHSRQHHRSQTKRRHNGKAPVFDRFTVEGDSWLAESWSQLSPPP
jgi:hypothetical protein